METKNPIPPAEIGEGPFGRRLVHVETLSVYLHDNSLTVHARSEEAHAAPWAGTMLIIREESTVCFPGMEPDFPRGYSTGRHTCWNADLSRLMADYLSTQLDVLDDSHRRLAELFIKDARNAHARRKVEDFLRKNPERIREIVVLLGLAE